ncbi:protein DA1-related 1 [Nicotiana tabacum]|uniref:Protein DA1-related 1 n=1 Tax=Nicotiana tabacum TaxID=4097 RepID=A0A1S3ZM38_TOBAC|nr:protein DA1-related 1 [Nicotiana tomentosiformis]XP_009624775.1 protein DA1-related 1 [Nicotiana tomentosiformis]XP_009624776.1 protein DA1-related 1 [Nicotiana tomentosiformis]XP_009624777.1 protein DA1-related 1 [Nicotiana tomentosiformis]XP_016465331.1 PREDICTED: protein DA1-related 1-like [Nicotiana tabacum]XP_016465332.1 PREDICTED: protein DA1-related 1-like [Nicotiana tabacum]XP_016465333.1 PREDICTED: protein DA1-related 1-like [Nicotiana tabacum]XP_016465334.1 PREDICTED: protein DA
MGWLEKIFGGSTHRISGGQYHGGYEGGQYHGGYEGGQYHSGHEGGQYQGGYEDSTIWEEPTASVDALSDFDNEEIDRAIALSLAEEDQKGKKVIESEPNLEEDEALAKALQESLNVESSPPQYDFGSFFPPVAYSYPRGYRVCAGCNAEIGHGRYLSCMGAVWHPECFRCHGCNQPISDYEFSMSDNRPYHKSCYKEQHHPKCDVCKNFIPTNPAGLIEYRAHPFWLQKYCPSHETDGTPRCCSCERMEPVDARYLINDDGRKLCLECLDSAIMDTHECQPLYLEIQEFYEGLNMKVEQQIPLLLVERQALNEAMEGEKNGHHHMPETRGLCLSEEQTISTISRRPRIGGYRILDMFTEPCRLIRRCEVTAILILYGLPRLLTGSILAHEMMHAWLRLKGYPSLSPEVEEGICQVLAHMWLDSEIIAGSGSNTTSASSSASSSSSSSPSTTSSKKGKRSEFEKKLGDFFKHQIESDTSATYGDGFREGNKAVLKYGLKTTLDHIKLTGTFPC